MPEFAGAIHSYGLVLQAIGVIDYRAGIADGLDSSFICAYGIDMAFPFVLVFF